MLECEVKWALGRITTKLVQVTEFQLSYQILKDDAIKVLHSICQEIWKTQQWPQDGKMSVQFRSVQSLSRVRLSVTL